MALFRDFQKAWLAFDCIAGAENFNPGKHTYSNPLANITSGFLG
jgi:hypothetical protein